ncbi:MAG: sodium:calcium antiporter [Chloroflexota bacterium]
MLDGLSTPALLAVFGAAAAAVWLAGLKLSDTTDVLSHRLGLGEALGGLILLAIATNLPEMAITVSAALADNLGIAIGNILGGIALQTVVLVILDLGVGRSAPLTYRAASLVLVLEGILVMAVLIVAIMGSRLPASLIAARIAPDGLLIAVLWIAGVWLVSKARLGLPWHDEHGNAPEAQPEPPGVAQRKKAEAARQAGVSTARTAVVFGLAAVVTLLGGVALEESGTAIASRIGMTGVLFGATFLAAATALPEVSTGLAAVKLGDYQLAFSDIFGGNAFLPVLFLLASLVSGKSVLPQAQDTDIYLAGLGVLLTGVYLYGLIFRPRRQILRMGIDSFVVLMLYAVGIVGLVAVASNPHA